MISVQSWREILRRDECVKNWRGGSTFSPSFRTYTHTSLSTAMDRHWAGRAVIISYVPLNIDEVAV